MASPKEEAIVESDSFGVGTAKEGVWEIVKFFWGIGSRTEGRNKHEESRAGKVKVGEERVTLAELVGRIDKNRSRSGTWS